MTISTPSMPVAGYEMREAGGHHQDVTAHRGLVDFGGDIGRHNKATNFWGKDGFGFDDFIDVINPLQHIPVVSSIYRALTDDEISYGARLAGGTLFGGPLGFVAALANAVIEDGSGKDVGGNMIALLLSDDDAAPAGQNSSTMMADLSPSGRDNGDKAGFAENRRSATVDQGPLPAATNADMHLASGPAPATGKSPAATAEPAIGTASQHEAARQAALRPSPQMTGASFDALMQSIGATPATQLSPSPGWKFGAAPALTQISKPALDATIDAAQSTAIWQPVAKTVAMDENNILPSPTQHRHAMDIHRALSNFYREPGAARRIQP